MNFNVRLLKVEDRFFIEDRGLIVVPPVDLPESCRTFKSFSTKVMVIRPDQSNEILTVSFMLEHLSLIDGGYKWDIAVMFPDATKDIVPIGSILFITEEDNQKLKGKLTSKAN